MGSTSSPWARRKAGKPEGQAAGLGKCGREDTLEGAPRCLRGRKRGGFQGKNQEQEPGRVVQRRKGVSRLHLGTCDSGATEKRAPTCCVPKAHEFQCLQYHKEPLRSSQRRATLESKCEGYGDDGAELLELSPRWALLYRRVTPRLFQSVPWDCWVPE